METMSQNINELMGALSKAQGKIRAAKKSKTNPFHKSQYADLASIWDACRDVLSENGLAVVQTIDNTTDNNMILTTILGHSSGQWIKGTMPIMLADIKPQTIGSTLTYYRRYSLSALVGIAPDDGEDDDGQSAQESHHGRYQTKPVAKAVTVKPVVENQQTPSAPHINDGQARDLELLLKKTPKIFQEEMLKFLKERKWEDFQVPISSYASIRAHFEKNIIKEPVGV